jgi:hypothetical protein
MLPFVKRAPHGEPKDRSVRFGRVAWESTSFSGKEEQGVIANKLNNVHFQYVVARNNGSLGRNALSGK